MTDTGAASADDGVLPGQFVLTRDRDAWPVIRGFAYQVDLTIMRWMELRDEEALELERGEDIDLITGAITARSKEDADRRLEQIKHRVGRISLRSDPAKEALANFHEHRTGNSALRLRFRFTTNAGVAREKNSPVPSKVAGIEAWELLRAGTFDPVEEKDIVAGLRALLLGTSRPSGIAQARWTGFQEWLAASSDQEFKDFAQYFEWAMLKPGHPSIAPQIRQALSDMGAARSATTADLRYRLLFFFVFSRLSTPGIKRLTRADLIAELARPIAADEEVIRRLAQFHDALAGRVDEHDARLNQIAGLLAVTVGQVNDLARRTGIIALVDAGAVTAPALSEPIDLLRGSRRIATVASIVGLAPPPVVVALHGGAESGKTQLALLISRELGERRIWVRFRGLGVDAASHHLGFAVSAMLPTDAQTPRDGANWEALCSIAASNADVVVLDDLPSFREGDVLGSRLLPFLQLLLAAGKSIVVTSAVALARLGRAIPAKSLVTSPVPPFTGEEVRDVLLAYGAPQAVLQSNVANLIVGITKGHPTLLHAVAQFLSARTWSFSDDVLTDLFRNTYAEPVNRETVRALLDGVTDLATRGLLYRLILIGSEFGIDEVNALAAVPPPLEPRREQFTTLVGPWVETRGPDRYAVSPLVSVLGGGDLAVDVRRGCHAVLARRIVSRRKIGELEFSAALTHFIGAEELGPAGLLLIQALHSVYHAPPVVAQRSLVTSVWRDIPLPPQMDRALRLQIRAYQAVLSPRQGKDATWAIADMEQILTEEPSPPDWSIFAASLLIVFTFAISDAALAAPFAYRALTMWPEMKTRLGMAGAEIETQRFGGIEGLIWVLSGGVNTKRDLDAWLNTVGKLPAESRSRVFSSVMGIHGAAVLASRLHLWEYHKPEPERNWRRVSVDLQELESAARAMSALPLVAAASAARLSSLVEAGNDFGDVSREAAKLIEELGGTPDEGFLIAKSVGFAALDAGRQADAATWLQRADGMGGVLHGLERVHVKLRLAQITVAIDARAAVRYAEAAVALAPNLPRDLSQGVLEGAERRSETGDILVPQTLGELALVRWIAGDRVGSGRALIDLIERLIATRADDNEQWKGLFAVAGHLSGYLTALITNGAPPVVSPDGGEYAAPKPGVLLTQKEGAGAFYNPSKIALIGVHAMQVADSIGDNETAVAWAVRTATALKSEGLWLAATVPLCKLAQNAVSGDSYSEAIEYAIDVGSAYMVARRTGLDKPEIFGVTPPPRDAVGPRKEKAQDVWGDIDAMVLLEVVLPAFLRVATVYREDEVRGRELALLLRDSCLAEAHVDELPSAGAVVCDDVWAEAARLCQDVFLRSIDLQTLLTRSREYKARTGYAFQTLSVMTYVGASLSPKATVGDRAGLHTAIGSYIQDGLGRTFGMYELVALPFFVAFWQRLFAQGRFHFRAPNLVASQISQAAVAPPETRLQQLLRAVVDGLGVTVDKRAREWMTAAPTKAG